MIRALYSAASGMTAQQLNVDNIANNLANSNTAGYKARRAQFQDLLYQNMIQPGAAAGQQTVVPTGLQLGLGTRAASNEIVFTQGDFSQTGNPLDVVIQGNGFFQILQPNGTLAYTRAGQFQLNATGNVVDANGNLLQPNITASAKRAVDHHRHRRNRQLHTTQSDRRADRGTDSARHLRQSGRPEQSRPELLPADHRFGRAHPRHSRRPGRHGHAAAGLIPNNPTSAWSPNSST